MIRQCSWLYPLLCLSNPLLCLNNGTAGGITCRLARIKACETCTLWGVTICSLLVEGVHCSPAHTHNHESEDYSKELPAFWNFHASEHWNFGSGNFRTYNQVLIYYTM